MKKYNIELKWAFIFSLATLLWMLLEKISGLHDKYIDYHLYLTNLFAIPAIWIMCKALLEKKQTFYQGNITYLNGVKTGLILSFLIACLSPLTQWITTYIITPSYFPNVIKRAVELGYYKNTLAAAKNFNFITYVQQGIIGALVMGSLTTLVAMIFIRTKK